MDYLSHIVVKAATVEDDDFEIFSQNVGGYALKAAKSGMLAYESSKSAPFGALQKQAIDEDEAILFFAPSKKTMITLMKRWQDRSGENPKITASYNFAITFGKYSDGLNKSAFGKFVSGKMASWSSNVKSDFADYKRKKFLESKGLSTEKKQWLDHSRAEYSMKQAKLETQLYNMDHNFYYCYLGCSLAHRASLGLIVIHQQVATPQLLTTWLEKGGH